MLREISLLNLNSILLGNDSESDGTYSEITNILLNGLSILNIKGGKAGDGGFQTNSGPYANNGSGGINGELNVLGDFQKSGLIIIQESIGDKNSSSFVRIRF